MNSAREISRIVRQQAERLAAERMSDIGERERLVALAHPGDGGRNILCGPVRHRGLEADQRFRLDVAGQRLLPAIAGAAVVVGQNRAAALGEIAGKAAVELAGDRGRRVDQDGMALGPAGQKQRRRKRVSIRRGHRDIVDKNVVQPRPGHRCSPASFSERPQQMRNRILPQGLVRTTGNLTGGRPTACV